jgi:hypothetical protein
MRGRLKKTPSVRAQSRLFCGRDEVENRTRLGTPLDPSPELRASFAQG